MIWAAAEPQLTEKCAGCVLLLCFFWLKLICELLKSNCFCVSCPSAEGLFFVAVAQQHAGRWVAVVLVNLFGGLVGMVWD